MPCVVIKLPGGGHAICKVAKPRPHKCSACGKMAANYQCDFPTPTAQHPEKTCDAWLCAGCSVPVGPDRDYCPTHPMPLFSGDAA